LIHGSGTVSVLYAGSLVTLLEKKVAPAFNAKAPVRWLWPT
jgi:hypothetical protein